MTMQNVIAFGTAIENDKAMQDELVQAVGNNKDKEAVVAVADFATKKGYSVTPLEIATGLDALGKMQSGKTEELSDQELEVVSGGKNNAQQNLSAAGAWLDGAGSSVSDFFVSGGRGLSSGGSGRLLASWFTGKKN